jgi:endonuclease G
VTAVVPCAISFLLGLALADVKVFSADDIFPFPSFSVSMQPLPVGGPYYVREYCGHMVCYDGRTRCPAWVFESLTPSCLEGDALRKNLFREDESLPKHVCSIPLDYYCCGYDRGHMAAAGNHKDSQQAMDDTFFMTNIAPQVGVGFNRGQWKELERRIRDIVQQSLVTHVISGPLYLPLDGRVEYGLVGSGVAVPSHFFKVVIAWFPDGECQKQAYIMPNRVIDKDESLETFVVLLEEVERLAGLVLNHSNRGPTEA